MPHVATTTSAKEMYMESTYEVAHADEVAARAKERHMAKLRRCAERARAKKARRYNREVWKHVLELREVYGCRCELEPGMTVRQMIELGAGCKSTLAGGPGWVCEVLVYYRRAVE